MTLTEQQQNANRYKAAKNWLEPATPYRLRDILARFLTGVNPDGTEFVPPYEDLEE